MSNSGQETDDLNFQIGRGRSRPQYKPTSLQCTNCTSPLTVLTEETELVTCPACDSVLTLSDEELQVTGQKEKSKTYPKLDIPLQTEFKFDDHIYKVIARLVYRDGWGDNTYEYLLYNPFFGSFYISRYEHDYTTSRPVRTLLQKDPFKGKENELIRTFDDQKWRKEEQSTMKLMYVEGALPWKAKIGDMHSYVSLKKVGHPSVHLEVEREGTGDTGELEYVETKKLTRGNFRKALQSKELLDCLYPPPPPPPSKVPFICALLICFLGIYFGFILPPTKERTFTHRLEPSELTEDRISPSFAISKIKYPVEICLGTNLNNAWMYLQWAVIKTETITKEDELYSSFLERNNLTGSTQTEIKNEKNKLVHIFDEEISYYYGGSGEDSWSEGSNQSCHSILFQEKGDYRIVTKAISGRLENETLPQHPLTIIVNQNAAMTRYYIALLVFSLLFAVRAFVGILKTK